MSTEKEQNSGLNTKSFITSVIILFILMTVTYLLTFIIPSGEYDKIMLNSQENIVSGTYKTVPGGISLLKWILSPILALGADGGVTMIAIIIFLLVIGGTFNALEHSGILKYMLDKITHKYKDKKYKLLCIITLFFMTLGTAVGSFEEVVPMVPIAIALSYSMGWDALVGLGMSILAVGCGFSTGVLNPFTVGIAQELAGLPMFSGISVRIISYVLIYLILILFLVRYAKKIEKNPRLSLVYNESAFSDNLQASEKSYVKDKKMDRGLMSFASILGTGILIILLSSLVKFLQAIIMPVIALIFLISGIVSVIASGTSFREYTRLFGKGVLGILPAALLILMAGSIKYTMVEAKIMDTILFNSVNLIESIPNGIVIIFIYIIILAMDFFISSGSAKAFLLMPLITPMVDLVGISRQVSVLAFAFGDGFSNLFYPTNPVLLISLGLAGISYKNWIKWSIKIQIQIILTTSIILLLAQHLGYS